MRLRYKVILGVLLCVAGLRVAAWAANNYRIANPGGTTTTLKSTDNAGTHTPHVNVDTITTVAPPTSQYPSGATPITASSANVANASAVATLAGVALKTTYICGFHITSGGSTAAALVTPTITGTITGTMNFTYATVAGVTLSNQSLVSAIGTPCIPASAVNTAIVVTLPALGAGNTNATVNAWGYQL